MAIANADGSIILSTKLDTSGVNKGLTTIRNKFAALKDQKATISTLTQAIKDQQYVLDKLNIEYAEFVAKGNQNSKQAQELKGRINDLTAEMKEMQAAATTLGAKSTTAFSQMKSGLMALASYFIGIQAIFATFRFSGEAGEFATQTEASVQRLVDIYGSASDSVGDFIDANARALGMSKAAAASFSSVYGNLFSVWADQATNAELTNRYLNMTAVVASKTGRTVEDVQERVRSGLLGNTEAIEDLGIFVNVKTIEMTDAFQRMADGKSWEQLDAYTQQQIRSMAILEQATAKYGDEVADTSATIRNRFNAAYQDFQNSWGTIVNQVLLPVLQVLTEIFNIATAGLNALSGRSGKILENAQIQEESAEKTAKNIEEQADAQKDLNKEMKKTLAGFDDIQILSAETAEDKAQNPFENLFGDTDADLNGSSYIKETSKTLKRMMRIVGAALVGIGVLLLMSKKIGWGIGFIIAGASAFSVSAAASISEASDLGVGAVIGTIMGIIGDALLAVGIILLFKGQIGWGIGFIVAGAALMAVEYFSTTEFSTDPILNMVMQITGIASTALLALGIILLFATGPNPLSIGLLVAGAVGLTAFFAMKSDVVVEWVKNAWNAVVEFWNAYISPVFTAQWWLNLGKSCLNGLISGFEAGVNGIIWLFEKMINFVVGGLNLFLRGVDSVIEVVGNVFGQDWGVATIPEVNLGRVSIPRLAKGAVLPPNKPFLSIVGDQKHGTNIETPLSTMVDAFQTALDERTNQTVREEHYYLNEMELASILYKLVRRGSQIQGSQLAEGEY